MDGGEIDEFLGNGGIGVLSLAHENDAYAVPVSYGYDASDGSVYLRLAFGPDSGKRPYVDAGGQVVLVVQRETDEGWRSVVAKGTLTQASETESSLDSTVTTAIHRVNIPFVSAYDRPARELDFDLYRLDPAELTGRREHRGD
jgi:hypothetical protein